jgi:hypothetical protein
MFNGRSTKAQHLARFMGLKLHDVANSEICGVAALQLRHWLVVALRGNLLPQGIFS